MRPYISRICPDAPLGSIGTNFGLRVRLVDEINCAKFYRNRLRGLDSMSCQSLTIPIDHCDIAVNTVLNYCSHCDDKDRRLGLTAVADQPDYNTTK